MYKSAAILLLPAVLAANHQVQVGAGGQQVFSPTSVTASVGDTLTFHWAGPYHSVSQSTFAQPCQYKDGGINSGVITMTGGQDFVVTVTDTNPIWVYCSVAKHCQNGMVMVVNPTSGQTFDQFKSSAATAQSGSQPGAVAGGTFGAASSAAAGSSSTMASGSSASSSMMSTMSSGSSAAAATMSTSGSASATSSRTGSTSATASPGAAVQYAGDVVAAVGAAALAVLL